jgi:DNA-binding transcriptional regulator YdaS (Cro superfamily)
MNLKTYLRRSGTTNTAFASKAGLSKSYVGRLVSGGYMPSWDVVLRIKSVTDGKVTERDWARQVPVTSSEQQVTP